MFKETFYYVKASYNFDTVWGIKALFLLLFWRCGQNVYWWKPWGWQKNSYLLSSLQKHDSFAETSWKVSCFKTFLTEVLDYFLFFFFFTVKINCYFSLRWESAAELCKSLLELCPNNCQLLESLATLYLQMEQSENAHKVWIGAFEKNPQNAEIFYQLCKFLVSQVIFGYKTYLLVC